MTVFRYDSQAVYDLLNGPQGIVANQMKKVATEITGVAKVICPRKTRELTKSIGFTLQREPQGIVAYVGANKEYAYYVHNGTQPHEIRVKKRSKGSKPQYLQFNIGGKTIYRKSVRHPGTKGRPFLTDAAKRVLGANRVSTT